MNDTDREVPKCCERNCLSASLFARNTAKYDLGLNPFFRGKKSASMLPTHDTVSQNKTAYIERGGKAPYNVSRYRSARLLGAV